MKNRFPEYLYESFAELVEKYGFSKLNEINADQTYWIEYGSKVFVFRLEKYRREFYVILYKTGNSNNGVNLFNLLSYLDQISPDVPTEKYFSEEADVDECYKKQLNYISKTIYDNLGMIENFFETGNYELKMTEIRKFMLDKYPELFKRLD